MDRGSRDSDQRMDEGSQNGRKSVRRLLIRFAEKTSMVGVPYINNAKLIGARIIWIILLIVALAAMGLHLWYLITQFNSFPYTAKVSFGFGNLKLPAVTICNTNAMHKGRFDSLQGADELKQLVRDLSPENIAPEQFSDQEFYDMYGEYYTYVDGQYVYNDSALYGVIEDDVDEYGGFDPARYDPNYEDWYENDEEIEYEDDEYDGQQESQARLLEIYRSLYMELSKDDREEVGHHIDDMLLSCSFNGRVCNASQFKLYQTPEYGNCWTLASQKFTVTESGPTNGLSMVLFLESTEYLEGITQGYGIQLEIHEPDTYPDPYDAGILIPASMETNVGLRMVSIERISKPHSDCEPGAVFKQFYGKEYTRRSCRQFCKITQIMETCGCYDDQWEEEAIVAKSTLQPCNVSSQWNCVNDLERKYDRKELTCSCKNPCKETAYNKAVSSRQWPTDGYSRILLKQVCDRDFDACHGIRQGTTDSSRFNNFLKLNIYYEDLNFEKFQEEADIEVAQFLSDVGGAIGLWIGLSILSLCEVIQLIVEVVDLVVHRSCTSGRQARQADKHSDKKSNKHERRGYGDRDYSEPRYDKHGDREYDSPRHDKYSDREYTSPRFDSLDDPGRRDIPYINGGLPRGDAYTLPYSERRHHEHSLDDGYYGRGRRH